MKGKHNPIEKEWAAVVKADADGGLAGEDYALCATEAGGDPAHRVLQSI